VVGIRSPDYPSFLQTFCSLLINAHLLLLPLQALPKLIKANAHIAALGAIRYCHDNESGGGASLPLNAEKVHLMSMSAHLLVRMHQLDERPLTSLLAKR